MIALAATGVSANLLSGYSLSNERQVHAALEDWGAPRGTFSANAYDDVYRRHVATLENIKKANPGAFHAMSASIYRRCMYVPVFSVLPFTS